jgi:hypothetical protein
VIYDIRLTIFFCALDQLWFIPVIAAFINFWSTDGIPFLLGPNLTDLNYLHIVVGYNFCIFLCGSKILIQTIFRNILVVKVLSWICVNWAISVDEERILDLIKKCRVKHVFSWLYLIIIFNWKNDLQFLIKVQIYPFSFKFGGLDLLPLLNHSLFVFWLLHLMQGSIKQFQLFDSATKIIN